MDDNQTQNELFGMTQAWSRYNDYLYSIINQLLSLAYAHKYFGSSETCYILKDIFKRLYEEIDHLQHLQLNSNNTNIIYIEDKRNFNIEKIKKILVEILDSKDKTEEVLIEETKSTFSELCPISRNTIVQPVTQKYSNTSEACDHIFDRNNILQFLKNKGDINCPVIGCNKRVSKDYLYRDLELGYFKKQRQLNSTGIMVSSALNYANRLKTNDNKGPLGQVELFDTAAQVTKKTNLLFQYLSTSKRALVHTGAGVSTGSGIPDFRGPSGIWTIMNSAKKTEDGDHEDAKGIDKKVQRKKRRRIKLTDANCIPTKNVENDSANESSYLVKLKSDIINDSYLNLSQNVNNIDANHTDNLLELNEEGETNDSDEGDQSCDEGFDVKNGKRTRRPKRRMKYTGEGPGARGIARPSKKLEYVDSEDDGGDDKEEYVLYGKKRRKAVEFILALPSEAHLCLLQLLRADKIKFIITQNIDGLHSLSGVPFNKLAELHGNVFVQRCLYCARRFQRSYVAPTISFHATGDLCGMCSFPPLNLLTDVVLDWFDCYEEHFENISMDKAEQADLHMAMGSSLHIEPACHYASIDYHRQLQAPLAIVNYQSTKLDPEADLIIHDDVNKVCSTLLKKFNMKIPIFKRKSYLIVLKYELVNNYCVLLVKMSSINGIRVSTSEKEFLKTGNDVKVAKDDPPSGSRHGIEWECINSVQGIYKFTFDKKFWIRFTLFYSTQLVVEVPYERVPLFKGEIWELDICATNGTKLKLSPETFTKHTFKNRSKDSNVDGNSAGKHWKDEPSYRVNGAYVEEQPPDHDDLDRGNGRSGESNLITIHNMTMRYNSHLIDSLPFRLVGYLDLINNRNDDFVEFKLPNSFIMLSYLWGNQRIRDIHRVTHDPSLVEDYLNVTMSPSSAINFDNTGTVCADVNSADARADASAYGGCCGAADDDDTSEDEFGPLESYFHGDSVECAPNNMDAECSPKNLSSDHSLDQMEVEGPSADLVGEKLNQNVPIVKSEPDSMLDPNSSDAAASSASNVVDLGNIDEFVDNVSRNSSSLNSTKVTTARSTPILRESFRYPVHVVPQLRIPPTNSPPDSQMASSPPNDLKKLSAVSGLLNGLPNGFTTARLELRRRNKRKTLFAGIDIAEALADTRSIVPIGGRKIEIEDVDDFNDIIGRMQRGEEVPVKIDNSLKDPDPSNVEEVESRIKTEPDSEEDPLNHRDILRSYYDNYIRTTSTAGDTNSTDGTNTAATTSNSTKGTNTSNADNTTQSGTNTGTAAERGVKTRKTRGRPSKTHKASTEAADVDTTGNVRTKRVIWRELMSTSRLNELIFKKAIKMKMVSLRNDRLSVDIERINLENYYITLGGSLPLKLFLAPRVQLGCLVHSVPKELAESNRSGHYRYYGRLFGQFSVGEILGTTHQDHFYHFYSVPSAPGPGDDDFLARCDNYFGSAGYMQHRRKYRHSYIRDRRMLVIERSELLKLDVNLFELMAYNVISKSLNFGSIENYTIVKLFHLHLPLWIIKYLSDLFECR